MSQRRDFSRHRPARRQAEDVSVAWAAAFAARRALLALPADVVLERARYRFRVWRAAGRPNPFCRPCTRALATRRFDRLCGACSQALTREGRAH